MLRTIGTAAFTAMALSSSALAGPDCSHGNDLSVADMAKCLGTPSNKNNGDVDAGRQVAHGRISATAGTKASPVHLQDRRELTTNILFDRNSAAIKPASQEVLDKVALALKAPEHSNDKILLEGHTDASGTPEINAVLSEARARAVGKYLTETSGLSPDRLSFAGKGSSEPADPEHPLAAENRRVVFVNVSQ